MKAKFVKLAAIATLALGISSAWAAAAVHQGTVLQTMNSGGYTYVQVKEADKTFWAAGPQTDVKKGDTVSMTEQMMMKNFTSNTLKQNFDEIMFVGEITKK